MEGYDCDGGLNGEKRVARCVTVKRNWEKGECRSVNARERVEAVGVCLGRGLEGGLSGWLELYDCEALLGGATLRVNWNGAMRAILP